MPWLKEYVDSVNAQLAELHSPSSSTSLERAVADALSAGGKRVRAILALLWCEAFGGDYRPAVSLAAAYELAHASALVQDDIIDHSSMRRGEGSIVAKYGLPNAILASDLLLFNVPKLVAKYEKLSSEKLAKLFDLVGEACRATTWGEYLDLEMAETPVASEEEYEEMISLKTAMLLSSPCSGGAIVGGASAEQASLGARFGKYLGMAYQVQDDTLDLVGDERVLGKPVFTDLRGGKKSLVLIHFLARCTAEEKEFIRGLMNRSGPYADEEASNVKRLLKKYGSVDYARERTIYYVKRAKEVLSSLPECRAKSQLLQLSDYLAVRYY